MPSVGSEPITLSFTAARNTDLTLTYRVLILPGASPAAFICLIQLSTSERRTCFMGFPANGTDPAASDIARTVPSAQTWRADHSPKNAERSWSVDLAGGPQAGADRPDPPPGLSDRSHRGHAPHALSAKGRALFTGALDAATLGGILFNYCLPYIVSSIGFLVACRVPRP
jgi:hypothetical protein